MGQKPQTLILGSMPGVASLNAEHYYAHPRNVLWPILFAYLKLDLPTSFEQRYDIIKKHHLALWDVLKHCEREGSLDSAIDTKTETPNDIQDLVVQYPSITKILLNGKKAAQLFNKFVRPNLPNTIHFYSLPSTSPANASMSYPEKAKAWHQALHDQTGLYA